MSGQLGSTMRIATWTPAVAAAYGWPTVIAEEEALACLLALNLERAVAGR
jgi:hypothetical protein